MTLVRSAADSFLRWAEASSWTLQSSLFVAVAFLCLFNCVVLGFLLFLSTQNATPLSKSKAAGLRAREHCESAACTQTPQKSPTKSVGKQQSYVPQLVVDGTVKAVTFPAPPPSLQSPFAEPTAGVNLELMSSLLMQSPRRTHRQQPAQQAQHQRSLSAEAPRVKLASELERSRTAGYLDRAFMASLSTVPSLAPQMPLSKSSISLGSRAYGGQALASSQDLGSSPSAQARQAEAELVDLDSLLGDTVAGVLLGRSGRTGHGLLDGLL